MIECVNQLNTQNKKLILCVENLVSNVERLASALALIQNSAALPLPQTSEVLHGSSITLSSVSNRLDKLEKSINSHTLICRGPDVHRLVNERAPKSPTDTENLKGELCSVICGTEVQQLDISAINIAVFGRERKSIKFECSNLATKVFLLKQARIRKPPGVFISEYLNPCQLDIFYKVRQLRKLHPTKIHSVFTRNGVVFYKLQGSDRVIQVNTVEDAANIIVESASVSGANISANSSEQK